MCAHPTLGSLSMRGTRTAVITDGLQLAGHRPRTRGGRVFLFWGARGPVGQTEWAGAQLPDNQFGTASLCVCCIVHGLSYTSYRKLTCLYYTVLKFQGQPIKKGEIS